MVDGVFIDNGLFVFGDVISGFTEIIGIRIEAEKIILDLEGDTKMLAKRAEDF